MTTYQRIKKTIDKYPVIMIVLNPDENADIDTVFTRTLKERVTVVSNE